MERVTVIAITLKEIAELAGVSRGTVDKVIHCRPGVGDETRRRVQETLEKHQYVPSQAGKMLANQKKDISVGVVLILDKDNDYFHHVKDGMDIAFKDVKQNNISLKYLLVEKNDEKPLIDAMKTLEKDNVTAIVIPPYDSPRIAKYIRHLRKKFISVVSYSTEIDSDDILFHVGSDHYQGGVVAASLLDKILYGSKRIIIFDGDLGIKCHEDRKKGFLDYLQNSSCGIEILEIITESQSDLESYFATRKAMGEYEKVDGVFVISRGIEGIISAIYESEMSRPKIVMFDLNIETQKFLSTGEIDFIVDQNPIEQGKIIVNTLFRHMFFDEPIHLKNIFTPLSIHIRESLCDYQ